MRDGDGLGRAVAVLAQNQVCFAAAWVVTLERIRAMQQYHHVSILLKTIM